MSRERALIGSTDPAAEVAADARAEADAAAGRVVSHSAVRRWLVSWDSGARTPEAARRALTCGPSSGRTKPPPTSHYT